MEAICKDVFRIIFSYLRPVEQVRLSMTCNKFYQRAKDCSFATPNIHEILQNKKDEWITESTQLENPQLFNWYWRKNSISLRVVFSKFQSESSKNKKTYINDAETKYIYCPVFIEAQYLTVSSNDHSFVCLGIGSIHNVTLNGTYGKKPKNLPKDQFVNAYKIIRSKMIKYISHGKHRNKLFPFCTCVNRWGLIPKIIYNEGGCSNCRRGCQMCIGNGQCQKLQIK